jgi:tetratricopeptide (TPR) repeat protein
MEFAGAGTLAKLHDITWPELRAILLVLLDALAHAHAHGVIHRDIKPENVLLCGRDDLRPGLKLTDFGIAFALEDAKTREEVHGTPHYMAPEQLTGEERDQGPWTDLYALGCLAWRLATGAPPFAGRRQMQLITAHRGIRPPALVPTVPVPAGFEWWLRTLLEKKPWHRFQCAADAASALRDLGHPDGIRLDLPLRNGLVPPVLPTRTKPQVHPIRGGHAVRAGMPLDWRRPVPPRPPIEFTGAGRNLFGLRPPVFTGREAERDALWRALTATCHERRAHTVLLEGPSGVGVSRLADWLASRAQEVGAAHALTAPGSDLEDLLVTRFGAQNLTGQERQERIDLALTTLFPDGTRDELREQARRLFDGTRLEGPSRYATLRLLLEALAEERPLVVVLDDVHHHIDAVRFARHIQNAQVVRPVPVLVVLGVGPVEDDSPVARELAALRMQPGVQALALEPMPRESFMALVQDMLGLEPELARLVVDRTAGNPAFALQIVGDWIARDQLCAGSRGFKLRPGARPQLPPTLKASWAARVVNVLDDLDPSADLALQVAAVWGNRVPMETWAALCDRVQAEQDGFVDRDENRRARRALLDRLRANGVAVTTDEGFRFTQGAFRNAVLDRTRRARRLRALHRAAAAHLGPDPAPDQLERYGRHLLMAGEREAALTPLLDAVGHVQTTVGRMSAWRLLDTVEHALKRLQLDAGDPRWGRLYIERATLADLLGKTPLAFRWARKAGQEAARYGWNTIAAQANFRLGRHAMARGDLDMAQARFVRVTNQVSPEAHPFLVGEALFLLGTLTERQGEDPEEARRLLQAGRRWMLRDPDPGRQLTAFLYLAEAAIRRGRLDIGAILLDRSLHLAIERGDLAQQVRCLSQAADLAERHGDLEGAAEKLKAAIQVYERIGDAQLALLRCALARVLQARGDVDEALQELDRALANAMEVGRSRLLLAVQCARLPALVEAGQLDDLDEVARTLPALMDRAATADRSNALAAERATLALLARGETARAHSAHAIAADQWRRLGDDQALERLAAHFTV